MEPPSYMRSVVDRNVVMRRMTVCYLRNGFVNYSVCVCVCLCLCVCLCVCVALYANNINKCFV